MADRTRDFGDETQPSVADRLRNFPGRRNFAYATLVFARTMMPNRIR